MVEGSGRVTDEAQENLLKAAKEMLRAITFPEMDKAMVSLGRAIHDVDPGHFISLDQYLDTLRK